MADFEKGRRYVCGRLATTPFENAYENPLPSFYDERTEFDSFTDFANTAIRSLQSWRRLYQRSVFAFVLFPPGLEDSKRRLVEPLDVFWRHGYELYPSGAQRLIFPRCETLDDFRRKQIEWLFGRDYDRDYMAGSAFSWGIRVNGFAEQCGYEGEGCWRCVEFDRAMRADFEEFWTDIERQVWSKSQKDASSCVNSGEFAPSVPYAHGLLSTRQEIADEFAPHLRPKERPRRNVERSEIADAWLAFANEMKSAFTYDATAGELLTSCVDAKSIQTYRWIYDREDEVNLIREAYLAGVRLWIEQVLSKRISFRDGRDAAAFDILSREVLSVVREAYTREAPSTLLGYDERDILRLAFPLMAAYPAESAIDEGKLREVCGDHLDSRELTTSDLEWANNVRFFQGSLYGSVLLRWWSVPFPRAIDTDFECRRVGIAFAEWISAESRRVDVETQVPAVDINGEQDAVKFVTAIAARCANAPALRFSTVLTESKQTPIEFRGPDEPQLGAVPVGRISPVETEVAPRVSTLSGEHAKRSTKRPKKEWWATEPPGDGWHDKPLIGTQRQLAHCVGVALRERPIDVKTLANMHSKSVWIYRVNQTTWQAYFHNAKQLALANAAQINLANGIPMGADGSESDPKR